MSKYPINKEFFPYSLFAPPIRNAKLAGFLGSCMKPPQSLFRDREINVRREVMESFGSASVELLIIEPKETCGVLPSLVYYHGGGFFFGGAGYHYRLAKEYSLKTPCKVIFVQYRLAPKYPYPIPVEDCYAALLWTVSEADRLGIAPDRIAVGGDSAGGNLAAAVALMARDRGAYKPCFQLLVYPVTDRRMITRSMQSFTDTPMWNSILSRMMWQGYLGNAVENLIYASPAEAVSLAELPPAYVESAEFDCLRDEGIAYAEQLRHNGVPTELVETKGTMHGFDIAEHAPTAKAAVASRIDYMKKQFYKSSGE